MGSKKQGSVLKKALILVPIAVTIVALSIAGVIFTASAPSAVQSLETRTCEAAVSDGMIGLSAREEENLDVTSIWCGCPDGYDDSDDDHPVGKCQKVDTEQGQDCTTINVCWKYSFFIWSSKNCSFQFAMPQF